MENSPTVDRDFVTSTIALAAEVDDRTEAIERHLSDNDIDNLWRQAVDDANAVSGLNKRLTFWNAPYRLGGVDYDLTLADGDLRFTGTDREGDRHSYTIPVDFLFPETREAAIARLREGYAAKAADARAENSRVQQSQRAEKEAEFERLGRELGRLPQP